MTAIDLEGEPIRVRLLCPGCGRWIESVLPHLVAQRNGIYVPDDSGAFDRYARDVYGFERHHHECYIKSGKRMQCLSESDPEFPLLNSDGEES